jgi:hypothetical protein
MNNKELAKKIVEAVNEEKSNYDAIDRVEEILNTIIKVKESTEVESSADGIWVAYVAGTMEYKQVGSAATDRGAYVKLSDYFGLDYESDLIDYLKNYEGETEEDFRLSFCEENECKVEYISLK